MLVSLMVTVYGNPTATGELNCYFRFSNFTESLERKADLVCQIVVLALRWRN
jgi:hypothetical protein